MLILLSLLLQTQLYAKCPFDNLVRVSSQLREAFDKEVGTMGLNPSSSEAMELFEKVTRILANNGVNLENPVDSRMGFYHFWKIDLVRRIFPLKFRPKDMARYKGLKEKAKRGRLTIDEFKELHEILND